MNRNRARCIDHPDNVLKFKQDVVTFDSGFCIQESKYDCVQFGWYRVSNVALKMYSKKRDNQILNFLLPPPPKKKLHQIQLETIKKFLSTLTKENCQINYNKYTIIYICFVWYQNKSWYFVCFFDKLNQSIFVVIDKEHHSKLWMKTLTRIYIK